jgi:hypothetical protein
MRYLIDERDTEPEISLALYKSILTWAAARSDSFMLSLQSGIYDNLDDETRLRALGKVTTFLAPEPTVSEIHLFQEVINIFSNLADIVQVRVNDRSTEVLQVRGTPDQMFVQELTRRGSPERATSGDLCPAEDVEMFVGDRRLYGLYDYGRTQVLDLTDEELESLCQTLTHAGLDPTYVIPAPPYITNSQ